MPETTSRGQARAMIKKECFNFLLWILLDHSMGFRHGVPAALALFHDHPRSSSIL